MKYKKYIIQANSVIAELKEEGDKKKQIVQPQDPEPKPVYQHVISLLTDSEGEVSEESDDVEGEVDALFNSDDGEETEDEQKSNV